MELTDPDEVFAILLKDNKQGGNLSSRGTIVAEFTHNFYHSKEDIYKYYI